MPPKQRASKDQVKQVVKLSATKTIHEIMKETGLSYFVIAHIQIREKVPNPKRRYRKREEQKEGEFFDIDLYAKNYIY